MVDTKNIILIKENINTKVPIVWFCSDVEGTTAAWE